MRRTRALTLIGILALCALVLGGGFYVGPVFAQEGGPAAPVGDQSQAGAASAPESIEAVQAALGTAFSYQGNLKKNGQPANTTCSFQFSLWDAAGGGTQVGSTAPLNNVQVSGGLFTVQLDFGNQFKGDARWLQTAVQCAGDAGFTALSPRQPLNAVPYAIGLLPGTIVEQGAANSPAILGRATNTNGIGLVGEGVSGAGVWGKSSSASGVVGITSGQYAGGVYGENTGQGFGVWGKSPNSAGVAGESTNWYGVYGKGTAQAGVAGESSGFDGVRGTTTAANRAGVKGAVAAANATGVWGESESGSGVVGITNGLYAAGVYGENTGGGFGVRGKSPNSAGVVGESTNWVGVYGETAAASAAAVWAKNKAGGIAGRFEGSVQITGGADLAERFNVSSDAPIEPGTLLVIDAAHPGQLAPSSRAYDSRVAGVASGAGGVKPGLTLHQEGVIEGDTEVAIAGRVYVKAEAKSAPIRPGDLLTSSDLPGHAMAATDRSRAYGAVIGKAMTGLESGAGMVLVLVNLQ